MVLVVYNGDSGGSGYVRLGSGRRLIIFYTLTDNGGWQVVKTFDIAIDLGVLYSVTERTTETSRRCQTIQGNQRDV